MINCYVVVDPKKRIWVTSEMSVAQACAKHLDCYVIDAMAGILLGDGVVPDMELPDIDEEIAMLMDQKEV